MGNIVLHWQKALASLLAWYLTYQPGVRYFFPKLFGFFILINVACYWWAILALYPSAFFGSQQPFYLKVQVPVGVLGALFDSASFFITIYIIRRAIHSTRTLTFMAHLSLDLVIAVLASCWVVFVFSVSGWVVSFTEDTAELLSERNAVYQERVMKALREPAKNWRNIYFGIIMGVSAMIPTCVHFVMAIRSFLLVSVFRRAMQER